MTLIINVMKHFLRDKKLTKILQERKAIMDESKGWLKKKDEIDKKLTKIGYRMNKLKEDTAKIIKNNEKTIASGEPLEEFEYIALVTLEKGVPLIEIKDQIEDYKQLIREKKKEDGN